MGVEEKRHGFFSGSGIPLKRIYTPEDVETMDYEGEVGDAGEPPFRRGVHPEMYRKKLWTIRRYSGGGSPEETNELFKKEYALGQTGFSIALDSPTGAGIDSDDPRVRADVGSCGVAIDTLTDMELLLKDLPIDKAPLAVISQTMSTYPLMAMVFTVAENKGMDLSQLRGTTQNDMMTTFALWFLDQVAPRYQRRFAVDFIEWCHEVAPRWYPVSFDSYNYRENGVSAVQELGMLLAQAIDYMEEELRRPEPMDLNEFTARFTFDMGCHNDFFEEIAKFRAARVLWHKIAHDRYGITNPDSLKFRFHAQSSGCTHTTQEPYNNLVRIAYQVLACALGGAQSVHANGYDEGLCLPSEQSMVLSIRTEQILQQETNVTSTVDPLGGSYYVEALTNEIERRAEDYIKKIEEKRGITEALEAGWIHGEYIEAMVEHEKAVNEGRTKVVGVNWERFGKEPYQVPIVRANPAVVDVQKNRIREVKRKRDNQRVTDTLEEVRDATMNNHNIMPAVMEAVKAYATIGEICNVWREMYGIWEYPIRF
jgi:methylmalonyl-CoA mutase N-terminal domain/subunit